MVMGFPVSFVVELIHQKKTPWIFPGETISLFNCSVCPQMPRSQKNFGPTGFQNFLPLSTDGFGHRQQQPVSFYPAYQRKPNSGVSAGGFQDRLIRVEFTGFFCGLDHVKCRSVLDGSTRVKVFQLGQNSDIGVWIEFFDFNQRCIAYCIQNRIAHRSLKRYHV